MYIKYQQYKGFTLTEVLITLGIIGIIAGLTIPSLIKNSRDAELKTALNKNYSILNQALANITNSNGGVPHACYMKDDHSGGETTDCEIFWSELKTNLKLIKEYTGAVDGVNIPNYTGMDLIAAQGGHVNHVACNGGNESLKANKTSWVLADGAIIFSYSIIFNNAYFFLDTNGVKKPNKWGYDLFALDLFQKAPQGPIIIEDAICGAQEKGGYNLNDILMNK